MVIDFTEVKLDRMIKDFDQWGDFIMSAMLDDLLKLYQQRMIEVKWEDGMPIPMDKVIQLMRDHEPQP